MREEKEGRGWHSTDARLWLWRGLKIHSDGKREEESVVQERMRKRDDRRRDSKREHERWNDNK